MVEAHPTRMLGFMATRVSSPVVVGRDAELSSIEKALERAAAGETVHLLVAGEAGLGKTRLTTEAARLAGDRGFRVLRGECLNVGGSSLPYGPFVEALRGLASELGPAATAEVAGPAADDLARLVPAFGSVETNESQSEWVQSRLFEGVGQLRVVRSGHHSGPIAHQDLSGLLEIHRPPPCPSCAALAGR